MCEHTRAAYVHSTIGIAGHLWQLEMAMKRYLGTHALWDTCHQTLNHRALCIPYTHLHAVTCIIHFKNKYYAYVVTYM